MKKFDLISSKGQLLESINLIFLKIKSLHHCMQGLLTVCLSKDYQLRGSVIYKYTDFILTDFNRLINQLMPKLTVNQLIFKSLTSSTPISLSLSLCLFTSILFQWSPGPLINSCTHSFLTEHCYVKFLLERDPF